MADNTDWFEGLATDEAKKGRIIRSWVARAAALAALLFIVASLWLMP